MMASMSESDNSMLKSLLVEGPLSVSEFLVGLARGLLGDKEPLLILTFASLTFLFSVFGSVVSPTSDTT